MVRQGFKGSSLVRAATVIVATMTLVAGFCLALLASCPGKAHAASIEDGEYELDVAAYQVTQEQLSMCNGALVNPATLTVEGSKATLELTVQSVKVGAIDGYLGIVQCFPDWSASSAPDENDAVDADVVSVYKGVKDEYNGSKSADPLMKGVSYPKTVSFPWNMDASECYLRVYVPVMFAISAESGWQLVRLRADYDTMKRVDGAEEEDPGSSGSSQGSDDPQEPDELQDSESSSSSTSSSGSHATKSSSNTSKGSSSAASTSSSASDPLDFKDLPNGTYTIQASLVKTDRVTLSMGDAAIGHTLTLHVSKGTYRLDMRLGQVTFSGQSSYLGALRYFKTGYGTDAYGAPTGATGTCKVLSYQTQGGVRVSDNYGTDYPAEVRITVIPEAKEDGFIPLQVFVPIMDAIAAGTGTQPMYLKLDTSSVTCEGSSNSASSSSSTISGSANSGQSTGTDAGTGSNGGSVISSNTLPSGGSNTIAGVSSQANTTKSATTSSLKQGSASGSAKSALSSSTASTRSASASSGNGVTVTPISTTSAGASGSVEDDGKQPPLRNAALPIGVAGGAAVALGVGGTLIRRRDSLLEEEL